jgi:hypothetical protein
MAVTINISWHGGTMALPTVGSGSQLSVTAAETYGPVLRDSEGANLVFNDSISTAEKLTIPAGAEIGRVVVIEGGTLYAISGDSGDSNIAAGGGMAYLEGTYGDIPIGFNDDGTRHDTLLVIGV